MARSFHRRPGRELRAKESDVRPELELLAQEEAECLEELRQIETDLGWDIEENFEDEVDDLDPNRASIIDDWLD